MIASLTGTLTFVDEDRIHLQVGPILYELLVPAADVLRLNDDVGLEMTFHTLLYLQGDANGGNLEPRLIGFLRREDKKFFENICLVVNYTFPHYETIPFLRRQPSRKRSPSAGHEA